MAYSLTNNYAPSDSEEEDGTQEKQAPKAATPGDLPLGKGAAQAVMFA